jgi:hypothetical protein
MERIYLIENIFNGKLFARVIEDSEVDNLLTNNYIKKNGYRVIKSAEWNSNESHISGYDSKGNNLPEVFID